MRGGMPTVLVSFKGTNGGLPEGDLAVSGSTLYGTTLEGGSKNYGTVFSVPTTAGNVTVLASFNGTNGALPLGGLTLIGSTLYGTTGQGGTYNKGTVFSVSPTSGNVITTK